MSTVKFRYNIGIAIAGLVAFFGAVPVATVHWYLAPTLLVPLAVLVWGWRAGTDADRDGLTVRALFGGRRLPWSRITRLVPDGRRVVAVLDGGTFVRLPGVDSADLPKLVAASGQEVTRPESADAEPEATVG